MSLYPGRARRDEDGTWVIDDAALADSMAKAIEDELEDLLSKVKGLDGLPEEGKEDRRVLFVAIARGVLKYLRDHEGAFTVDAEVQWANNHAEYPVETDVDIDVDLEGHGAH